MKRAVLLVCFCFLGLVLFAQQAKLMLPIGHPAMVFSSQFSPDGKTIITISRNGSAKLWEVETGKLLINYNGNISCGQFSPDGKSLIFGRFDGSMNIIDVNSGNNLLTLNSKNYYAFSIEYSNDGKKFLTTNAQDSIARIWDAKTGKLINQFKANRNIISARFSPDNEKIITWFERAKSNADSDLVKVWETKTGKLLYNVYDTTKWVNNAFFSLDNKMVFTGTNYVSRILDAKTGKLLHTFKEKSQFGFQSESFSPDSKKIAVLVGMKGTGVDNYNIGDSLLKVFDVLSGKVLFEIKAIKNLILSAKFSPDKKNLLVVFDDGFFSLFNVENGKLIANLKVKFSEPFINFSADETVFEFSSDGKRLITNSSHNLLKIWNLNNGNLIATLNNSQINLNPSVQFSADNKSIFNYYSDYLIHPAKIWNISNGKHKFIIPMYVNNISPDGKLMACIKNNTDSTINISDVLSGKILVKLVGSKLGQKYYLPFDDPFSTLNFSQDNKKYLQINNYGKNISVWNVETGKLITDFKDSKNQIASFKYSKDANRVIIGYLDSTAKVFSTENGKLIFNLKMQSGGIRSVDISPDGTKVLATDKYGIKIFDGNNGSFQKEIKIKKINRVPIFARFSPNGKRIISINYVLFPDSTTSTYPMAKIWDTETGNLIADLKGHSDRITVANFSVDGKRFITGSLDGMSKLWDLEKGYLVTTLKGDNDGNFDVSFSSNLKNIITTYNNGANIIWDAQSYKKLYSYFAVDSTDYLVTDPYGRYDGTEGARKLLYFTCGTEVIGLDQVKDQLWVPNLAERIMKGDSINAKKLSDLDICGLIPQVEKEDKAGYHFMITPQRGGLGETVLYVNDIEVKRYNATQLLKTGTGYELNMTDKELQPYFIAGQENPVTVKAYTAKNDIASRGAKIIQDETKKQTIAPNLYAVMIGVSNYKGAELQLKYAAKDATDISAAVKLAAGKLLGNDHVFTYNLTTGTNHYQLPEKLAIKNVLQEIGMKANANDILMIFFAGHGVTSGEKRQFYFLTADASQASATDAPDQVGISTAELSEWMKPSNIKAQKRILILDACNSGQAINELVKVGNTDQNYLAARNDDKAEQIKAIDKLNEKSGLFILAASASNQSAYEMGRYSQGLLTYALLKAIKQQPDILEDNKYLNVNRWFNAAEKTVSDMVRETGNRQEPQIVSAGNFNVGLVDQDVMAGIKLANEKALFTSCNFQNSALDDDNLDMSGLINKNMYEISARNIDSQISYVTASNSPDAWSLSGRYEIQGEDITIKINIKQNKEIKNKLELKGKKGDLKTLADQVVNETTNWILKNK